MCMLVVEDENQSILIGIRMHLLYTEDALVHHCLARGGIEQPRLCWARALHTPALFCVHQGKRCAHCGEPVSWRGTHHPL